MPEVAIPRIFIAKISQPETRLCSLETERGLGVHMCYLATLASRLKGRVL